MSLDDIDNYLDQIKEFGNYIYLHILGEPLLHPNFNEILKLLELPSSEFDKKIGDYYTALATDKRFILLDDGTWDLRSRHTSDKVKTISEEDEEDEDEEEITKDDQQEEIEEDNYDDTDDDYDDTDEDLKDLVVIDEDELELD